MPSGTPTGYSKLLCSHMRNGTRPDGEPGKPGVPWTIKELADKAGSSPATVRTWRSGARRPKYPIQVESPFFGCNDAYDGKRNELRKAHEAAGQHPASVGKPTAVTRNESASVAIGARLASVIGVDYANGKVGLRFGPPTEPTELYGCSKIPPVMSDRISATAMP
jgi:hypothetical protein